MSDRYAHLTQQTCAALLYDEAEDYQQIIRVLSQHIERFPTAGVAYHNRGVALWETGEAGKALEDFDRAASLLPDDYLPAQLKGMLLEKLGRMHEAISSLNRAVEAHPNAPTIRRTRGAMLRKLGRLDEALVDLDHAVRLEPKFKPTREARDVVFGQLYPSKKSEISRPWWKIWRK
jgi:tetratricopeptide (TPR) repeat protein